MRRDNYLDQLLGEFVLYCENIHGIEPGWSADPRCRLSDCEIMLLDPRRYAQDAGFAARFDEEYARKDWTQELSRRFANWLNHALGQELSMGDVENAFWTDIFHDDVLTSRLVDTRQKEEVHA